MSPEQKLELIYVPVDRIENVVKSMKEYGESEELINHIKEFTEGPAYISWITKFYHDTNQNEIVKKIIEYFAREFDIELAQE